MTRRSPLFIGGVVVGLALGATGLALAAQPETYTPPCTANTDKCRQERIVALENHYKTHSHPAPSTTPSPSPTPSPTPPSPSGWPDESNTGVPAGTTLTTYSGPCTITAADTVIDAKTVNCDLVVRAANVTVKNSKVNGVIDTGSDASTGYSITLQDSELDATPGVTATATGIGEVNLTIVRSEVVGGNRSANCFVNCTITDSYFHGQDTDPGTGDWHESGVRMGANGTIRHNTIWCEAPYVPPNGGCSADLTGYGDFGPVENNLIENNLFKASASSGFCVYGGSSGGKPYSNATNNIRFVDNVFEAGPNNLCGAYGPVTDFDPSKPGNEWTNNTWLGGPNDGQPVPSAN